MPAIPPIPLDPAVTRDWFAAIRSEMAKAVVGQPELIEQLVLTVLCREHALLEGPAGTAKSLAVESLAQAFRLRCRQIRASVDLDRPDLLGCVEEADPWQASLLLVDQIDRLSGKVSSLVQGAMRERVVEHREGRQAVPDPFVVFATRHRSADVNLVEPSAFDDLFLFQIQVPYPTYHEEYQLAASKSGPSPLPLEGVLDVAQLQSWQASIGQVKAAPSVMHYAVRLVRATRVHEGENPDFIYEWVQQGAGPRGVHFLTLAAKARATLYGRSEATHQDVQAMCLPVLRHRIQTNQNARENGIDPDRVVRRLVSEIPPRVVGDDVSPGPGDALTFHDWIPADEPQD